MSKQNFGAWCRQLFFGQGSRSPGAKSADKVLSNINPRSDSELGREEYDDDPQPPGGTKAAGPGHNFEGSTELDDEDAAGESQLGSGNRPPGRPVTANTPVNDEHINAEPLEPWRDKNGMAAGDLVDKHSGLESNGHPPTVDVDELLDEKLHLESELARLRRNEELLGQRVSAITRQNATLKEQIEKLKTNVRDQKARVIRANENAKRTKETTSTKLETLIERNDKLKLSFQEQRSKLIQANQRTAEIRELLKERTAIYKGKLAASRENLILKNSLYNTARKYFGIYRQGLLYDEIVKSDVDFSADAYLCLLPSSVPAGLALSHEFGGRVYCDSVENVEVHKHSLAPNVHKPTLELINLAAYGALTAVDGITTVGNALARTLERFGPRVHVLPNFRWYEQANPAGRLREMCSLAPGDQLLFASGNVVVGFEPVVQALALLPENVHLAAFVKLKPNEYRDKVLAEIDRLDLTHRIHFFDFVEYSELAKLAADADIGLITSDISNPNGAVALPNRLFDYLAAELPVIAPAMPDVVDLAREYGFGITLDEVSAINWAIAIEEILSNSYNYKRSAVEANRKLTWESQGAGLIEFLGNPKSVTLIGFRDISRYQRFLRIARTLTSNGIKVKAIFLSDNPAVNNIAGADFYHFSDRYGLGSGPELVSSEGTANV